MQRVAKARVTVEGTITGEIGRGAVVLLGVARGDGKEESARLAAKVARLRIFDNGAGKFSQSLLEIGGAALVVSQFTLIADTRKGNRPSFTEAAPPEHAEPLYELFCDELAAAGVPIERGVFGARMRVELVNDGPVTVVLDI